jgi:hypothetical protein
VRSCRRSGLSKAAANTVIPVTAIGAEKLSIWATSWTRAAPAAQTITAAAAQAIARRTTPDAFARKLARPVSRVAFAFPLMRMTAISVSPRCWPDQLSAARPTSLLSASRHDDCQRRRPETPTRPTKTERPQAALIHPRQCPVAR